MKKANISIKKHILIYGIILGIITTIYSFIGAYTKYHYSHYNQAGKNLSNLLELLFYISFISFAVYRFKKLNYNLIILKQALMIGVGSMLVGSFILCISNIILYSIDSNKLNQLVGFPEEVSILSEKSHFQRVFYEFAYLFFSNVVFHLILGLIISLIVGAIMHKRSLEK